MSSLRVESPSRFVLHATNKAVRALLQTDGDYPKRGGALIRMDGGIWLATVGGRLVDHPPTEIEPLMEYAKVWQRPVVRLLVLAN